MSLPERHQRFVAALRAAGLAVSLAESLDAVAALARLGLADRQTVRAGYAATLVKQPGQRATFDGLFDLFFPAMLGEGVAADPIDEGPARDSAAALEQFRQELLAALSTPEPTSAASQDTLASAAVGRFGAMPGRGPGQSAWSAYTTLRRVAPSELIGQLTAALNATGGSADEARRVAIDRVAGFEEAVQRDVRRRVAEQRGPEYVAETSLRPVPARIDFSSARRNELDQLRRQIYPLARRLATRLTQEHHAQRQRGPLDFRRTVRASMSTGGVPLTTRHRPKRPHRTDLVVLCDVSGSVANFAQFTLLLVFALRDQFSNVRAFTFVDDVVEVTRYFTPGADPAEVLARLAASAAQAARLGRTDYGRAITRFAAAAGDALGPRSSLLILGDARSNYSDLALPVLGELVASCRHAWWLNPEHPRHWNTGDSAAREYGAVISMVECRNLTQLGEFVHDLV